MHEYIQMLEDENIILRQKNEELKKLLKEKEKMSDLDDEELKATRNLMEEKPHLVGGIYVQDEMFEVEKQEFRRLANIYKGELMHINESMSLTDTEKALQASILNKQVESLRNLFRKMKGKNDKEEER